MFLVLLGQFKNLENWPFLTINLSKKLSIRSTGPMKTNSADQCASLSGLRLGLRLTNIEQPRTKLAFLAFYRVLR